MSRCGVTSVLVLSQVLLGLTQAPLNIQDIKYNECRVWGVFHVTLKDDYNLNLAQAQKVCKLLDSVLATTAQVDRTLQEGFERCRYGWVEDGFVVIPRITPKELCGQNKTGLVIWKQDRAMQYDAYCFRQNDSQRANACEPLIIQPTTYTTEASSAEPGWEVSHVFHSETVPHPDSRATTLPQETRSVLSTLTQTPMSTQADDETDPKRNKPLLGDQIIYCVMAVVVVLLLAFLVILICFLRKRKSFTYSSARRQKENIEAEVWSHSLTANNSS